MGDDAGAALAAPLTPGPLLRGQVLLAAAEQGDRVRHEPLHGVLAGQQIQHPQGARPVRAGTRAQEDDP